MESRQTIANRQQPEASPSQKVLSRLLWLKIVLLLFFGVVAGRLVQIQVINSEEYVKRAQRQYEAKVPLLASRGNIYDRNGKILASTTMAVSYAADPTAVGDDAEEIAERFANVFGRAKKGEYLAKLKKKETRFVWLERQASPQTAALIMAKSFKGLIQMNEPKRTYYYDYIAGQALGFTDIDNNGKAGVELEFDNQLKGKDGYSILQRDGLGRTRPTVDFPTVPPVNGNSIVLTLDLDYQSIAEEELRKGVERNKATGGLVVMLDPQTGEVLAMANYPSFNPNRYQVADTATMKNRVVAETFEPGSVFKIVTVSAALENGIIKPDQPFYAELGKYQPRGRPKPINDLHKYGTLTFREAFELSSNIVMAKASDLIGAEKMYTMARNFGFGTATGLGLPQEVNGQLNKPNTWSRTTLNTMAYGYEISVTPLQLAAAYAALANDGVLMKPTILKQILNERNEVIFEASPEKIRRVISKGTRDTLTTFLRGVVERGTAKSARSNVVHIAGKTGTSQKLVHRAYSTSNHTASFVGMFPAEHPELVCLVMLDIPTGVGTGGVASAPVVKEIAEKVVARSSTIARQTPHEGEPANERYATPDVRSLDIESAKNLLASHGFEVETTGEGAVVLRQSPAPGTRIGKGATIRLATSGVATTTAGGYTVVPDVRGLSLRRALNALTTARLGTDARGSGVVVSQSINAGEQVKVGTHIGIRCEPKRIAVATSL